MQNLNLKEITELLKAFSRKRTKKSVLILTGALALESYGYGRRTIDVDAEVSKHSVEELIHFLSSRGIPCDISSDISRWSVISLPPGYRNRCRKIYEDGKLTIKILHPLDLVLSKLRRGTEEDFEDALYLARRFSLSEKQIRDSAHKAVNNSPKDTMVFIFQKNIDVFIEKLKNTKGKSKNNK